MLSPPQYWCYPSTVLNSLCSTDAIPHSTYAIPHMYWCYPSTVLVASTVLMLSPNYWTASTVLMLSLHSTDVIPPHVLQLSLHSTEQPPQYWCYSSTVLTLSPRSTDAIPPQYWTASAVLMLFPTCTDAIPHSIEQPPQYWTASAALNRRYTGWFNHSWSITTRVPALTYHYLSFFYRWLAENLAFVYFFHLQKMLM